MMDKWFFGAGCFVFWKIGAGSRLRRFLKSAWWGLAVLLVTKFNHVFGGVFMAGGTREINVFRILEKMSDAWEFI